MARSVWKGPFVDGYLIKKVQKFILVSDAMPPAGTKLKHFLLNNKKITAEIIK